MRNNQHKKRNKADGENLRTEYAAISAKLNQLPSFRFALVGFYVAAFGVIALAQQPTKLNFIILFGLTLVVWLVDLRTRGLLMTISNRGMKIERKYWRSNGWIVK